MEKNTFLNVVALCLTKSARMSGQNWSPEIGVYETLLSLLGWWGMCTWPRYEELLGLRRWWLEWDIFLPNPCCTKNHFWSKRLDPSTEAGNQVTQDFVGRENEEEDLKNKFFSELAAVFFGTRDELAWLRVCLLGAQRLFDRRNADGRDAFKSRIFSREGESGSLFPVQIFLDLVDKENNACVIWTLCSKFRISSN